MGTNRQRQLIKRIRRETFGIGTATCNTYKPLTKMLHEAIVHLSAELYQKDIHFVSELLQNAEDNNYGNRVSPSLELVLTSADIARVGATATLVLFNNEVGFQPQHVKALCAVGLSTKKGKRDSGYIGEKGIGFKSVFLVTGTPYVISNGYRFRFTDEASTSELGYVVPEWVDVPTDDDLRKVYGKHQLPQTIIILPLRPDKVEPVREQLKQVSPETLLFLSKLRQLVVREDSKPSLCITRTDVLPSTMRMLARMLGHHRSTVATVKIALGSNCSHVLEECTYHMLQQQFPVTHRVEQRKEVDVWNITIAFPVAERINPGRFTGDIYAFLPSYLTSGFPFVVNADFLLVASRETLKFDSPWNIGILSCVPDVFLTAFKLFLSDSDTVREAYRYIPVKQPQNAQFLKIQQRILEDLKKEDCLLVDSSVGYSRHDRLFCTPNEGWLILPEFRKILVDSKSSGNVNPAIENPWQYIVDRAVQDSYRTAMNSLGVPNMKDSEYVEFLDQEEWLLNLSELLYWDVVCFVYNRGMFTVPVLKYCKRDGSIGLASFQEAQSANGLKIYLSPAKRGEWLSEWTSVFKPWVSVQFMPEMTVRTLKKLRTESNPKICSSWDSLLAAVPDFSVKSYVRQLLDLMATATNTKFVLLTTEFIYQCIRGKYVELKTVSIAYPRTFPIVDQFARINRQYPVSILLPAQGSLWPKLRLNSWSNNIVVMSDDYLTTVSIWTPRLNVSISNKEEPLELESFRSFLRSVISAGDIPYYFTPPAAPEYLMPEDFRLNITIELVELLLRWLTTCLTDSYTRESIFFKNLKETEWIPTEAHGWRRPSSCFERSSFSAFFQQSDLPCVQHSLIGYRPTLEGLGVVIDVENGCNAVVNYIFEISKDVAQTNSCDLGKATRLYEYLQKFRWEPVPNAKRLKIFAPGGMVEHSTSAWKDCEACVIHNDDGFFDDSLTVLQTIYPKSLLNFFSKLLGVPLRATVERYCELWLKWRIDVHEFTVDECTRLWKILSEKWAKCDPQVQRSFVAQAWVPSVSEETGAFQLSSPSSIFIPDDLDLRSLFDKSPGVKFVWYPDQTEKMECGLNKVYVAMGVKKLSECVQPKFIGGANSKEDEFVQNQRAVAGDRILCGGLFRAILGFMAIKKYGLSSSERQDLLSSLKGVEEISITRPITRSYTISCLTPSASASQESVLALWSKKERKFYRVDYPILGNSLAIRHYGIQLATTISHGLLYEHPLIAEDLTEFLAGLVASKFEESHVEYKLVRKNARLYEEDESFLSERNLPQYVEDESQYEDI